MTEHLIEKQARTAASLTREMDAIRPRMHALLNEMLRTVDMRERRRLLVVMDELEAVARKRALGRAYVPAA